MSEIQFLTDGEYEAIRVDMHTITEQFLLDLSDSGVDVSYYPERARQVQKDLEAKLTAYVDQKIKKYY